MEKKKKTSLLKLAAKCCEINRSINQINSLRTTILTSNTSRLKGRHGFVVKRTRTIHHDSSLELFIFKSEKDLPRNKLQK